MRGLISKLWRRLVPQPSIGYVFRVQADFGKTDVYGAAHAVGMQATIAVRTETFDSARDLALAKAKTMAAGAPVKIIAMRKATDDDFVDDNDLVVQDKQEFGLPGVDGFSDGGPS